MSRVSRLNRCIAWLLQVNQRWDTPGVCAVMVIGTLIGATTALTLAAMRIPGLDSAPPIGGDAVIYDSMAWELSGGHGFSLNFDDPEFIEPYLRVDPAAAKRLMETAPRGPIASRPPLLPLIMAGFNQAWGRQFQGIRLVNIAAMGTVAALVVWTVFRLAGPVPAVLGLFQFLVVDPRIRVASREVLTESLACLLVALLTIALVRLANRPRPSTAALAGGTIGLAMLLRTMFVLWIPVIALQIWLTPRRIEQNDHGSSSGSRWGLAAVFVLAACVVFAPWGWRNCQALGRFMPLGTQGTMELSAGYSDATFERWGMWHNMAETGFFTEVDSPDQTALQRELARADYSRRRAVAWCTSQPLQAALLPLMKVFQEFRPHMSGDLYILAFAILGLAWIRGTPQGSVWLWIIAATAFGVALTWSVAGRFVFPPLYVLQCAAAIGVWNSVLACTAARTSASDASPVRTYNCGDRPTAASRRPLTDN